MCIVTSLETKAGISQVRGLPQLQKEREKKVGEEGREREWALGKKYQCIPGCSEFFAPR